VKVVTGKDRAPLENLIVSFKKGETIFNDGDLGTEMYIIQKGRVEIRKRFGSEVRTLSTLEKGDFFGEMSILEGLPRSAMAVAAEDCECLAINEATFDQMLHQNLEIAVRMLRKLSNKLRETTDLLNQVAGKTVQVEKPQELIAQELPKVLSPYRLAVVDTEVVFTVKKEGTTLVGRKDPVTEIYPDIDLSPHDTARSISRRHAKFVVRGDQVFLQEDIGTTNGTFLNGEKLQKGEFYAVHPGDEVQFGLVRTQFSVTH
jgi:CRP-like cAMP-binding protein